MTEEIRSEIQSRGRSRSSGTWSSSCTATGSTSGDGGSAGGAGTSSPRRRWAVVRRGARPSSTPVGRARPARAVHRRRGGAGPARSPAHPRRRAACPARCATWRWRCPRRSGLATPTGSSPSPHPVGRSSVSSSPTSCSTTCRSGSRSSTRAGARRSSTSIATAGSWRCFGAARPRRRGRLPGAPSVGAPADGARRRVGGRCARRARAARSLCSTTASPHRGIGGAALAGMAAHVPTRARWALPADPGSRT